MQVAHADAPAVPNHHHNSRTSVTEPACAMSTNTEQAERRARQKACSGALADSLQRGGSVG